MNEEKKKIYIICFSITIIVLGLSIVYIALTTSLKIKYANLVQNTSIWNVKLKKGEIDDEKIISSGNRNDSSSSATEDTLDCGHLSVSNNAMRVDAVKLSRVGDMCSYPIKAENKGEINAKLSKISAVSPVNVSCESNFDGEMICGSVVYRLTTDSSGNNLLKAGNQRLRKLDGTADFYLVVSAIGENKNGKVISHSGAGFTVVYAQDD